MKRFLNNFKYNFRFLKVLNSPLKGLKLKWYFGEIAKGVPYFLPRKTVKCTMHDANEAWANISPMELEIVNKRQISYSDWAKNYLKNRRKFEPIKYFGFNYSPLGWKTKWNDYRFEWNPFISIVLFGKQLFIEIVPNIDNDDYVVAVDCYWETWLNWEYNTDKSAYYIDRFIELVEKHSNSWRSSEGSIDYYEVILNEKYLNLYKPIKWTKENV
jgi:hypothetical protein